MSASALLKFSQGSTVGGDGEALLGKVGTEVALHNVDSAGVRSWQIDLAYADPGSSYLIQDEYAFNDNSGTPAAAFTPDWSGSYRWVLKVWDVPDRAGDPTDVDIRVFSVPETNGLIIPPSQIFPLPLPDPRTGAEGAKPNELNFGGSLTGWAGDGYDGLLSSLVRTVDLTKAQQYIAETIGASTVWLFAYDVTDAQPGYIRVAIESLAWDQAHDTTHAYFNRTSIFRWKSDLTLTHMNTGEVLYGGVFPAPVDGAAPMSFPHSMLVRAQPGHIIAAEAHPALDVPIDLDLIWVTNVQVSLTQWY